MQTFALYSITEMTSEQKEYSLGAHLEFNYL